MINEAIPADKKVALLAVVDEQGSRFVAAARSGDHWTFAAELDRLWTGEITGRVLGRATR